MATTSAEFALGNQERNSLIPVSPHRIVFEGHTRQGAHRSFLMQSFAGEIKNRYKEPLQYIASWLSHQGFSIPIDQAREEVDHNLKGRLKNESIVLASTLGPEERGREKLFGMSSMLSSVIRTFSGGRLNLMPTIGAMSEPTYIGYSTQESWLLPTEEGPVKVMYVSTMVVLPEHRRMGLGAKFLGIANSIHEPDIILLRLRSGAVVAALRKSELIHGKVVPFEMNYDEDPLMGAVLRLADKKTVHPNPVDPVTGVTKAVYKEGKDLAYEPDPSHQVTFLADRQIREIMNPDEGDGVYVGIRVIGRERWLAQ